MKKSLTVYASALAQDDIDVLSELIANKYRKFLKFYHLIEDYSEDVKSLDYEFGDTSSLDITITFEKNVNFDKKELISEMEAAGYAVDATIKEKKMKLKITHVE